MGLSSWLRHWTAKRTRRPQHRLAPPRCQPRFDLLEDRLCPSGVTFGPTINWAAGDGPVSVAVADFNGDGHADLAVANNFSNNVSVLLGNGSGGFAAPENFAAGSRPNSVAVADFNGDGHADLAVANNSSPNVSVFLGNGAGEFTAPVNFATSLGLTSVAVADFNGDGHADLAVANSIFHNVSVLLGDGRGGFAAPVNFGVGFTPRSVAVADFNGDGHADLAVANVGSDNVSVLLGDGTGNFGTALSFPVGNTPFFVAVGDFNGDGRADLAVANTGSDNVSVLLNTTLPNQPPTVSDFTRAGAEDNLLPFTSADFTGHFHDADGDVLAAVQIVSLPPVTSGSLQLGGVAVTAGQVIAAVDLDGLVFVPAPNFSGTVSFQYTASDGFLFATTPATVTLQIVSAAQQAANLQAQIDSLFNTGVLNKGQANALTVKLDLKGNSGDSGKIQSFLNQVAAYLHAGLLTQSQADELLAAGAILLVSVG